jgi:tetratricopeptide (TPR) repeat protein
MLGWHLRHLELDRSEEALHELHIALELNPSDPETLGMIGGLFKRRREFIQAAETYAEAYRAAPTSTYIRVNRAAMLILSHPEDPAEGQALYEELLQQLANDPEASSDPWKEVVAGEAAFALLRDEEAREHFRRAQSLATSGRELRSTADQIELLGSVGFRSSMAQSFVRELQMLATQRVNETFNISRPPPPGVSQVPETPVIVRLSDIHFGTRGGRDGPVEMHRFKRGDYEKTLSEHLYGEFSSKKAYFRQNHPRIYLVVSGDLTYQGTEDEFKLVCNFLKEVCINLDIAPERVVLVPGNHDVHWASAAIDKRRRFDNYLGFLLNFYGEDLFRKIYPLIKWNFHVNSERPSPEEIVSLHNVEGLTILGLNSCVYETEQNHYGFVGGHQLDNIETLLDLAAGKSTDMRVAVLHHHLHPFPEPIRKFENQEVWMDLSTIRDAGLVERRLEKLGFDIVLHGHKHKPQLRESLVYEQSLSIGNTAHLIVCGAGSTGVNASELEHAIPNHYEVIDVLRLPRTPGAEFLSSEWREIGLEPSAEWRTRRRWVLSG